MWIKNKWFTIIEILIAITIVVLLIVWVNTSQITKISENQKIWIFKNKIKSNIETAINNSLAWKAVDNTLLVPKYWKIEINNNYNWAWFWTGNIRVSYGSWTFQPYTWLTIKPNMFYEINNIVCNNLTLSNENSVNKIDLLVNNWNITLSWCTDNDQKIITFDVIYKNLKKEIIINSVNNVISSN